MLKQKNGLAAFLTALVMIIGLFMPISADGSENGKNGENPGTDYITVYVSFEGYNLGHGFYIEPTALKVPAGTTADVPTIQLLTENGHDFDHEAPWGFYLDNISGFNKDYFDPPEYITAELADDTEDGGVLGSLMYSEQSGFMYTVNHESPPVGANDFVLSDGDVIRWQFSLSWGEDFGLPGVDWTTGEPTPPLYEHADKTELIRALFAENIAGKAYQTALHTIINPTATADEVADAIASLAVRVENPAIPAPGQIIGGVVYTDITAYINGNAIPSNSINNYTYIAVEDLKGYGFDVVWDESARIFEVERDKDSAFNPLESETLTESPGAFRCNYYATDIQTVIAGGGFNCYDVNGRIVIRIDALKQFGTLTWDSAARELRLVLN